MKNVEMLPTAFAALAICCAFTSGLSANAQQTAPDNSQQNKHHSETADSQPNETGDRITTAKVRKAIIADKKLSMYAHNVKIITLNGHVTLKGPVKSAEEKQQVNSDAITVVSVNDLTNELSVKQ